MGMGVTRIDQPAVVAESADVLGVGLTQLTATEGLAASLRRAASFVCPTSPGALVRQVCDVIAGLPGVDEGIKEEVTETLQALLMYGDLLELDSDIDGNVVRQVFLGPPAYVEIGDSTVLLIGIRPEGEPLLDEDALARVEQVGHIRRVRLDSRSDLTEVIREHDLAQIQASQWLLSPEPATAPDLCASYESRLALAGPADGVELDVLDPNSSVRFYRGRWREIRNDTGRFVCRRPQAFGSDLWCFAEISSGVVVKLIDLPIGAPPARGADEAWRLQAAIDARAGHPQQLRVNIDSSGSSIDFFSPLPTFVRRRLDAVGTPRAPSRGALLCYELPTDALEAEVGFVHEMMWLSTDQS
jgi:hypothetical protein